MNDSKRFVRIAVGVAAGCVVLVLGCGGGTVFIWNTFIAEYNELDPCPDFLQADDGTEEALAEFTDNGGNNTPELAEPLVVADLTLTAYSGRSWQPGQGPGPGGANETRVLATSGAYIPVDTPDAGNIAVSADRRTATVLPWEYGPGVGVGTRAHGEQLGLMDLETGDLTWADLPFDPSEAVWSPTDREVLVLVGGEVRLLDPDTGESQAIPLSGSNTEQAQRIEWEPDGEHFRVVFPTGSAVFTLDGEPVGSADAFTGVGFRSPSGDRLLDGERIVEAATGESSTNPGLDGCAVDGHVHSFRFQAWVDDDHLLVVQEETAWVGDHRRGEADTEPRGNRLIITDLEGRPTQVLTNWGDLLPDTLVFDRA